MHVVRKLDRKEIIVVKYDNACKCEWDTPGYKMFCAQVWVFGKGGIFNKHIISYINIVTW